MSSYVGDSELFCDQFSTLEMRTIFDDRNTVQKWLDTEVELAQAEADLGLMPQEAAIQISEGGNASEYEPGSTEGRNGQDKSSYCATRPCNGEPCFRKWT